MVILVTGGAGFIGTHICACLLELGHEVVVVDDFSNSSPAALDAVRAVSGNSFAAYELDIRDRPRLDQVFRDNHVDAVIHLAAKKSVRESVQVPCEYYDVNIGGLVSLVRTMDKHGVQNLVFSSSCSIYGAANQPMAESRDPAPTNPYARSKLMSEQILTDVCVRNHDMSVISLRYFNPIGAHPSGMLGEDPSGVPSNVLPYVVQAATGRLPALQVFGDDYETPDGTGVRDYIHVMDVAEAHCLALDHLADEAGMRAFNLGTGIGVSVLELLSTFEAVTGATVPYEMAGRQPGDVDALVADPAKIEKEWGWRATRSFREMLADAWRFHRNHPEGYRSRPT